MANFTDFEVTNIEELKELWYTVGNYLKRNHNNLPRLLVTIKEIKKARTLKQTRALYGVAYKVIHEATGHDVNELHRHFCGEYFGWDEVVIDGRHHEKPKRTTTTGYEGEADTIDALDFGRFYDFIQQRSAMAEPPIHVPDPDIRWKEKLAAARERSQENE